MHQYVESTLLLLAIIALLAVYFRLHNRGAREVREAKKYPERDGVSDWIEDQLREPKEKAADLFGQPSWLIVYNKYSNSPDSEEEICRSVTWAFCRGKSIEPVEYGIAQTMDIGTSDLSGTLVICQRRHSFLAISSTSQNQNS
jgi:hypothetical protein